MAFDQLNGIVLSLWRRACMAQELACTEQELGPAGVVTAHNVRSEAEVEVLEQAAAAGAAVHPAQVREWGGRTGYFQDPDGHRWEVAWNPQWSLGSLPAFRAAP